MSKGFGNDYLLWIESTTPGTYNLIKGQQGLNQAGQTELIDTSTKDNFPYGTSAPGLRSVSIDCEFIPDLPDANGFTRMETIANTAPAVSVNFQIRKGGPTATDTDKVFSAKMFVTNFVKSFGQNEPRRATCTLVLDAAPTIDALE
jgi:Phage tail tube protein